MSESETELEFTCVNELRSIIDYNFLFLLTKSNLNKLKVKAISDISVVDRTAPAVTIKVTAGAVLSTTEISEIALTFNLLRFDLSLIHI